MEKQAKKTEIISAALEGFGNYVDLSRKQLGMTFETLAEKTNLSPSSISNNNLFVQCSTCLN